MTAVTVVTRPRSDKTTAYRCQWRPEYPGQGTSWTTDDARAARAFEKHARKAGVDEALRVWDERAKAVGIPTVREAWTHWMQHRTRPKQGTLDKDRRRVEVAGSWMGMLEEYPVSAVTREDVVRWVKARSQQVAPKTVRNEFALLSSLLSDCVKRGLIASSPTSDVRLPKAYGKQDLVVLSTDEFNRFIAALPPWWRPLVWTLASTGLRINEATALRWQDINLPHGLLTVQHGWHKIDGGWALETPKTPRSRRTIDLDPRTIERLAEVRQRAVDLGRDVGPDAFVFTAPRGGVVRDNPLREDVWHPARKRAELRPFTPHDMRHLHASWMLAAGSSMEDVAERLGHESPQITYATYSHLTVGRRQRMVAGIAAAMAEVRDPTVPLAIEET